MVEGEGDYYDRKFRIMAIGLDKVGKSAIFQRYNYDKFRENYISTVGVDYAVKTIDINGQKI